MGVDFRASASACVDNVGRDRLAGRRRCIAWLTSISVGGCQAQISDDVHRDLSRESVRNPTDRRARSRRKRMRRRVSPVSRSGGQEASTPCTGVTGGFTPHGRSRERPRNSDGGLNLPRINANHCRITANRCESHQRLGQSTSVSNESIDTQPRRRPEAPRRRRSSPPTTALVVKTLEPRHRAPRDGSAARRAPSGNDSVVATSIMAFND